MDCNTVDGLGAMLTKTMAEPITNKKTPNKTTLGMVAHTYHPSTTESEAETDQSSRPV